MKKNIVILVVLVLVVAGLYAYSHHCKQLLREVDRYALPKTVEFMNAIDGWNYETVKPLLSDSYISSLSSEAWQDEFKLMSVLGELKSFARPNFVAHTAYKKYKFCESAIDMYSVSSEFEKDNAVIRIFFDNDCGKLKVRSFIVTSASIVVRPEYLDDVNKDERVEEIVEELTDDEREGDLDSMYEDNQEDAPLPELDDVVIKKVQKNPNESNYKSHGKAYRY